jgi:hypothetical protein
MNKVTRFSQLPKHKIMYPNMPSALKPVPHDESVPVPNPTETFILDAGLES